MDGFCKAATLPEIEANNFVLSPGRYVGSEAKETNGVPLRVQSNVIFNAAA
ncbi:SAM-dependent methyltransferase [Adhaeribacter swui]|uniref:SAM-dependent methyltransferase n=1 Tax=Adhaeribacter swui TaxID=2086471 RepID=UPI0021D2280B|nr:SAM-dependent methyltransferase [Adhaeribacter swui]